MAGLLDLAPAPTSSSPGILGNLGNFFSGIGGAMNPAIQENNFRRQAYQALAASGDPGSAALLMANPQAYQMQLQQRIMQQTYQNLLPKVGPQNAALLAMNPNLMGELAKPQAVQAGGMLSAPLNLLSGGPSAPDTTAPQPQAQPEAQPQQPGPQVPLPQPAPQMPSATPQMQPAKGAALNIQNTNGILSDEQLMPMAQQYVFGNADAFNPLGRSMSGIGGINRARGMQLVQQLMKQQGIDSTGLAANQMKYQGLKGTINDIYKTNNALNTGIGHMSQLVEAFQNLGNANFKPSNYIKNLFGDMIGKAGPVNYEAVASRVAPEVTRIWRGSGGAEADIERDIKTLSSSNSPEQGLGAMANIARMMASKMDTNRYQFEGVYGPGTGDWMVSPQNKATIQRLEAMGQPQQQNSGAVPHIANENDYKALKSGQQYYAPDGSLRTKR